jgi:hypothetical protein
MVAQSPPSSHHTQESTRQILNGLLVAVLAVGVGLRLYHYIVNRSLWLDEASLALNLLQRSGRELLAPLDHYQGAPLGFLFMQDALLALLGSGERSLRLLPLLASIAGLLIFPYMAARYVGPDVDGRQTLRSLEAGALASVVLATALFAVGNYAVYYATEAKQYSVDLLASIVLLYAGAPLLGPQPTRRELARFALVAALAVPFSHPAVFVIGALGIVAMGGALLRRDLRGAFERGLAVVPAALLFLALYALSLRSLTGNRVLLDFWAFGFAPLPPWSDWSWLPRSLGAFLANPGDMGWRFLWPLPAVGLLVLARRRPPAAITVVTSLLLLLAASALRTYPFAARMALFLLPMLWLTTAVGVQWLAALVPHRLGGQLVGGALAALLLVNVSTITVQRAAAPYAFREHYGPALAFLGERLEADDRVYCYTNACPPFEYYAAHRGLPPVELLRGAYYGPFAETSLGELDGLAGSPRAWLVMSRPAPGDEALILERLDAMGRRLDGLQELGVGVYLYDLRAAPAAP